MELKNLITFIHVVELGSFTRAAELLGYSQSTISFQIKQLESELGCLLFERINHTITLTERGRELVSYAHRVRSLTDELRESVANESDYRGHVHIVTPDSVCEELLRSHYIEFRRSYPDIAVKFTTADTTDMFDMLDRNEADAIITLDIRSKRRDYIVEREKAMPMHFVASAASRFSGKRRLKIADIASAPFILTEYEQDYRRVFDKELAKRSLSITPALEIGRTDVISKIVSESEMLAFLPDFVTKPYVDAGQLCYLDVSDFGVEIWKQLIYHKNKWISRALRAFLDFVIRVEFDGEEAKEETR